MSPLFSPFLQLQILAHPSISIVLFNEISFYYQTGSGFKLGPVTGEFLADLVSGKPTKFDGKPFQASRFGKNTLNNSSL